MTRLIDDNTGEQLILPWLGMSVGESLAIGELSFTVVARFTE